MNNTPTPETDELDRELHTPHVLQDRYSEMRDHAQKLERERDEALMDRANGDIATMTINHYERILRERDEARESLKHIGEYGTEEINAAVELRQKLATALVERDEWKNKAYSHATDYTLMEAKCFRLEQQLKEYDKLKS